jgi:hypothetical protein
MRSRIAWPILVIVIVLIMVALLRFIIRVQAATEFLRELWTPKPVLARATNFTMRDSRAPA